MINLEFSGNEVYKDGQFLFRAPTAVRQVEDDGKNIYVRFLALDEIENKVYDSNIYCLNLQGDLLWKIEPVVPAPGEGSYTEIILHGDNLRAYAPIGFNCLVDKETGKILKKVFTK